ncbi:hypothetical protein CLM85_07435, partial [Streptomyces albidoflavus]
SRLRGPPRPGRAGQLAVRGSGQDDPPVLSRTGARATAPGAVLGRASPAQVGLVRGAPPTPSAPVAAPPGRGWVRLGDGPVQRLQVPAAPDPYDEGTAEADRRAVLELLPPRPQSLPVPLAPTEPPSVPAGADL